MIQTLTRHPEACLIAYLSLVVLTFVANPLGLISWLAWLFVMRRIVTKKSATAKTQMNIGGCTGEKRTPSVDLLSQMILEAGLLIDDFCASSDLK